ncbi:MAG: YdbL family protein [Betaproteobacteria bacterium]|nr:YdbL family protein [Betaproteobacteria bacterium]
MKKLLYVMLTLLALSFSMSREAIAQEAPDMRVNSPVINELRESMRTQFVQIKPLLESGVLGMKMIDGSLVVRDPAGVPVAERQKLSALINANTRDKAALYREIARLNGHPEWEADIAETFARTMREKMPAGWWVQDENGNWAQKKAAD